MNHTTGAQRYNKRMDKIFANAKKLNKEQDDKVKFMGRNIGVKDDLFCLTWSENDILSNHDRRPTTKWYFNSYILAHQKMIALRDNGTHWFDAHFDPTI